MKEFTNIEAIKAFFADSARKLENREIMQLTKEDRAELGALAATALGGRIKES